MAYLADLGVCLAKLVCNLADLAHRTTLWPTSQKLNRAALLDKHIFFNESFLNLSTESHELGVRQGSRQSRLDLISKVAPLKCLSDMNPNDI